MPEIQSYSGQADLARYSSTSRGPALTEAATINQSSIQAALNSKRLHISEPGVYPVLSDAFLVPEDCDISIAPGVKFSINGYTSRIRSLKKLPMVSHPAAQIRWGSYGDSIANISSTATQDLRTYTTGNVTLTHVRMGPWLGNASRGLLRPVFNGGVSGETTTQMVARESAGAGATRKAMLDAQTSGVEFLVMELGINDIQTLAASASQSQIDTVVGTALANVKFLMKKARACGITPILKSCMPYSIGSAAENVTRMVAVRQLNAAYKSFVESNPNIGYYFDAFSLLADGNGWIAGFTDDGLHPNHNGCEAYCIPLADMIMSIKGVTQTQFGLPNTPIASANMFDNPDLSASSSGVATRFTLNGSALGTGALSGQRIVEIGGINYQEWVWTPSAFDGNGNASCSADIVIPCFGGSPFVAISNGDLIAAEADIYADDGFGGGPAINQYFFRFRIFGSVGLFSESPGFNPTISPATRYVKPLDVHPTTIPTTAGEASATMTNITLTAQFFSKVTTPVRFRIGDIRVVKLPAGY